MSPLLGQARAPETVAPPTGLAEGPLEGTCSCGLALPVHPRPVLALPIHKSSYLAPIYPGFCCEVVGLHENGSSPSVPSPIVVPQLSQELVAYVHNSSYLGG
jgi:hypothetical protein